MLQKHLFISGRVQGVGFRHFTVQRARQYNINGWVRNRSDGRVEAVVLGSPEDIEAMLDHLKKGPVSARVGKIVEHEEKPNQSEYYTSFDVKPTM